MSTDIRRVLGHGAARPSRPVDVDAVLRRSRQLGRRRTGTALATIALVVPGAVVAASVASREDDRTPPAIPAYVPGTRTVIAGPGNEVALPPDRSVTAVVLNDGSRAYVVRHEDGDITVVEAISSHRPFGLQKQIGWCPTSHGFEDVQHGSRWDAWGKYVYGPAPSDLATYEATADDGTVRVGERHDAASRSRGSAGGPPCADGDPDEPDEHDAVATMTFADFPTPAADLVTFDDFGTDQSPIAGVFALDAFVELGGYRDLAGVGIAVCGSVSAGPDGVPSACAGPQILLQAAPGASKTGERVLIGRVRVLLRLPERRDSDTMPTTHDLVQLPQQRTFVPGPGGWTAAHTFGFPKSVTLDEAGGHLTFDEAEFLSGEAANAAAREAGEIGPSDTVPNDYYIRNVDSETTTYRVDSSTEILTLDDNQGLVPTSLAEFARKVNGETGRAPIPDVRLAHVFRNADGTVSRIVEQYVP